MKKLEKRKKIIKLKKRISLAEAKELDRDDFLYRDIGDFQDGVFDYIHKEYEMNTCDKCDEINYTGDLVWITAEDFEPKDGEIVTKEMYSTYDALCEECYMEMVRRNQKQIK